MPQPQIEKAARAICTANGYNFIEYKGEGAFKETFHVHLTDGSSSALKVCRPGISPERTQREIDAMIRCNHPNIANIVSVGQIDDAGQNYLFILEEYLSGGNLKDRLSSGLISRTELLPLGKSLISALQTIAAQDLVHRDIKPDNVMFRADGITPVIVDFGLVRDLSNTSLTQTWQMRGPGSAFYAAPEQLNNDKHHIDARTDQFAIAVLFSLCLFGFHPYSEPRDTPHQTVDRVAQRLPLSSRFISATESNQMAVLKKMAASWPVGRYRTPEMLSLAWPNT